MPVGHKVRHQDEDVFILKVACLAARFALAAFGNLLYFCCDYLFLFMDCNNYQWITCEMPEDEEDDECGIVFLTVAEICMIET